MGGRCREVIVGGKGLFRGHREKEIGIFCVCTLLLRRCSQAKRKKIKRVLDYCQTSVFSLSTVSSFVDHRAYKPYTLVGPPVL